MKKRKRKPNNSASRQQAQAKSQAAAKKRQEEDFARQLTAMFQAEQGEERASASASKPESRRTRIAGKGGWELSASEPKAGANLQDTAYFIPGRSRIKTKPSRLASPILQDDSPVDAEGLRAAIAATLREAGQLPEEKPAAGPAEGGASVAPRTEKEPDPESKPAEDVAFETPRSDADPAPEPESAEDSVPDAPRSHPKSDAPRSDADPAPKTDPTPSDPEGEDGGAPAAESDAGSARPVLSRWRAWLDKLSARRRPETVPVDPEQLDREDAASIDGFSSGPLRISFDEQADYSGELEPSRTPWEQDADWSDARLFRELDRALADDSYSEALSGLFRDQGTTPPAVTSPEVLAAWLSYEPEPAPNSEPTPEPEPAESGVPDAPRSAPEPTPDPEPAPEPEPAEDGGADTLPADSEPIPDQEPTPEPEPDEAEPFTIPLLPELERRRSKGERTAPEPKLTFASDEEAEPDFATAAMPVQELPPDPVPCEADAGAQQEAPPAEETAAPQTNWRKDSLPTLGELFGSLPKAAASAEPAQAEPGPENEAAPERSEEAEGVTRAEASPAEQTEGEEKPAEPVLPALGKKMKQTWAVWASALHRIREQAASAIENDVIEPASEPTEPSSTFVHDSIEPASESTEPASAVVHDKIEPASEPAEHSSADGHDGIEPTSEPTEPIPEPEPARSGDSDSPSAETEPVPDPEPVRSGDSDVPPAETEPVPEPEPVRSGDSDVPPAETEPTPEPEPARDSGSDIPPAEPEPVPEPEPAPEKPQPLWRRWLSALLHPQVEELEDPEDLFDDLYDDLEESPEAEAPDFTEEKPVSEASGASLDELLFRMTEPEPGPAAEAAKAEAQPAAEDPFLLEGLQLQEEGEQLSWANMLFEMPSAASAPEPIELSFEQEPEPASEPEPEPASEPEPEPVSEPTPEPVSEPVFEPETAPAPEPASQGPQAVPIPEEDDFPELLPVFREEGARPSGGPSLDWKTLLAAAVPMEDAEPPKSGSLRRTGRPEHGAFRDNAALSRTVSDRQEASEPPAGTAGSAPQASGHAEHAEPARSAEPDRPAPRADEPVKAAPQTAEPAIPAPRTAEPALRFEDVFGEEADRLASALEQSSGERSSSGHLRRENPGRPARRAERGFETEDRRRAPAEDSLTVPDEQSEGRADRLSGLLGLFRGRRANLPSEAEVPELQEDEPAPQPSAAVGTFQSASEPVPSASVKRRREAEKLRPRRPEPEPEPEEPEEEETAYPEEACRRCARELSGVGTRLILTGLFTILSLFFTLYLSMRWTFMPEVFSGGTTVYLLLLLLAAILASDFVSIREAIRGVREKRFSPVLLILAAALFTALDTFAAAKAVRPTFTVVVGALLLVELWGRYDRGMAMMATLKVLREPDLAAGVSEVMDTISGKRSLTRTVPDVERFMQKLETRSFLDRIMSIYTPVALAAGLVITGLVGIGLHRDLLWTGSLVFLGSVPMAGLLVFPRLFLLMANKLSGSSAAICGYHGAEAFGGEHAILIGDEDIFPAGALALNGFKVYNGSPDRLIAYAAAAAKRSGSALAPLFDDLLLAHNGRHYTVDTFRFYDSGGIGATIIGDVVLMGSLEFMRRMGVHMDKGTKVRQAVYMSVNGELAAVYAVKYNPPENLRRGLASIAGNRHFKGILVTRTFLGTPGFLKAKFGIPTGSFEYPDTRRRLRLSHAEMKRSGAQGAILAKDSFTGFAQAAAGGRVLRSATALGALLAVLSGVAGLLLMGVLASLPAYETATAVNLLFYVLAWLAPTLLLTSWARHF